MARKPAGTADGGADQPKPYQMPGAELGLVQDLRRAKQWPPGPGVKTAAATPYLVAPAFDGDAGVRPISGARALKSAAISLLDGNGALAAAPVAGTAYTIAVKILNLGATACYAGLADFYVEAPGAFDAAARGGPGPQALARTGFSVRSQDLVTAVSPRTWTPASPLEALSSLLVHVQDFVVDPLRAPFGARADRHVARCDFVPDFLGMWQGALLFHKTALQRGGPVNVRIEITQSGVSAACTFTFMGTDGLWPTAPQSAGAGTIIGTSLSFAAVAVPFVPTLLHENWTLTLTNPDNLHAERVLSIMLPGIEPIKGDLVRI
jgi:hypothetical protein